jgi:tRNA nucleotidyltransferase (CCA-adding enzyme)
MDISFITEDLKSLRAQFVASGFDLRLVGGIVRDTIAGIPAKDIDLCTNATPEQQVEIYQAHGHRWIETGLQHGTVTVVLGGEPHEITSLRIDVDTDGRHAEVEYTTDWHADLARRDLTINAMAMTFDGEIIDPFGGQDDLVNGVVRFVGDADARIREDFLRILRFFRFHGRFGKSAIIGGETWDAIVANAAGLRDISRERVWSEIQKIAVQDSGPELIAAMQTAGIHKHIDLPAGYSWRMKITQRFSSSPELLMAAWCDWTPQRVSNLAANWKWSRAEQDHVEWICDNIGTSRDLRRLIAIDGVPREWVVELAKIEGRDEFAQFVADHWVFEPFPVTGHDLMRLGFKPGKTMGSVLRQLKEDWAQGGYTATKRELLARVPEE